jgi:hypothetical protein
VEANGSSSSGSDNICEDTYVAEEVDGSSSWGSEVISEEACVAEKVDGSSSWPVPEGVWHPKYICCTIKYTWDYAQLIKLSE